MKRIAAKEVEAYLEESRGLERDYLDELVRSRKSAWRVAIGASCLTVMALGAVFGLTPLKKAEAFVVRVDNATGSVEMVTSLRDEQISYGEAVDKYFLNQYVLNREGYDYETLQSMYDATALLSSPEEQQKYYSLYEGPKARDKVLGSNARIVVRVRSIAPVAGGETATIRFTTQRQRVDGLLEPEESMIATVGYKYVKAPMKERDRRVNPLGFQVTSYRADPEVIGTGRTEAGG